MKVGTKTALLAVGIFVALWLFTGWQRVSGVTPITRVPKPPDGVVGIPDPREVFVIEEGSPYVVPKGHVLVITALGAGNGLTAPGTARLFVDGINRLEGRGQSASFVAIPPHFVIPAGSVVAPDMVSSPAIARAWGYLIDA